MEPVMCLLFFPVFIVIFLALTWLDYDNAPTVIMHAGLLSFIAIGGATYYQTAKKSSEEIALVRTAQVAPCAIPESPPPESPSKLISQ